MQAVGKLGGGTVQVRLTLPAKGLYEGGILSGDRRETDQSSSRPLLLSGIRTVDEPATEGPSLDQVINRAPLGEWSVTLLPLARGMQLEDIRLALFAVAGTGR